MTEYRVTCDYRSADASALADELNTTIDATDRAAFEIALAGVSDQDWLKAHHFAIVAA